MITVNAYTACVGDEEDRGRAEDLEPDDRSDPLERR